MKANTRFILLLAPSIDDGKCKNTILNKLIVFYQKVTSRRNTSVRTTKKELNLNELFRELEVMMSIPPV